MSRTYRCYLAELVGDYVDLRGQTKENAEIFAVDSYADSQPFGEAVRATSAAGILYPSIRKANGLNIVGYRPSFIRNVRQAEHFEISVQPSDRHIDVRMLSITQ